MIVSLWLDILCWKSTRRESCNLFISEPSHQEQQQTDRVQTNTSTSLSTVNLTQIPRLTAQAHHTTWSCAADSSISIVLIEGSIQCLWAAF